MQETSADDIRVFEAALLEQFDVFLDEHRRILSECLEGLTEEEEARTSIVRSKTTLLGLVKHATFVEQVWFDETITCGPGKRSAALPARTSPST